jgi:N6-adenosine-specific RNA methylase IME4
MTPAARYHTIVADPPWPCDSPLRFAGGNTPLYGSAGGPERYGSMTFGELCELQPPAADNAHLYLWTINTWIVQAHEIALMWGFKPKTVLTWTKTKHDDPSAVSMKTGYYFRGATEHVVFAVRGSLPLQTPIALPTGYLWPRLPHSVKPDAFYDLVEQASPGPYLELFARRQRLGWDTWGNQALEHVEIESETVVVGPDLSDYNRHGPLGDEDREVDDWHFRGR